MAVGDTYRLRIVLQRSAVHPACINNFYFRQESPLILDTPGEDLVEAWRTFREADYTDLFTSNIAIVQYQVAKAPLFETEHAEDFTGVPGGMTGDSLPPRTSICLSWRTSDFSRRGRGRVYLPPASESANGIGAPAGAYVDAVHSFGLLFVDATMGDDLATALWQPMIWSKADQAAKLITGTFTTPKWTSQRDRDGILSA